jgi:hypothetical protein
MDQSYMLSQCPRNQGKSSRCHCHWPFSRLNVGNVKEPSSYSLTHFGETPLNTGCPSIANVEAGEVAQLGQGGAHLWALKVRFQNYLGWNIDNDNGVDDGHGGHDRHHHGAEQGQAEFLLACLRRVRKLGHLVTVLLHLQFSVIRHGFNSSLKVMSLSV